MPWWKPGHTTKARWLTPTSHVKQATKSMTNAGRTLAAGVVLGAWQLVSHVIQMLKSGSVAQVEVGCRHVDHDDTERALRQGSRSSLASRVVPR